MRWPPGISCLWLALLCCWSLPVFSVDLGRDFKALILMPGPLIEAHAKEEKSCEACHSSFDKSAQNSLCLVCHEDVARDLDSESGFHGIAPGVVGSGCNSCHSDHKGREYDSVPLDKDTFNHQHTDFPLSGGHLGVACASCHEDKPLREAPGDCVSCHEEQNRHRGFEADKCDDCHVPDNWLSVQAFDHGASNFPLKGQHENLQCSSCHAGGVYSFDSTECVSCHRVGDVHAGRLGDECESCHSQTDWATQLFDHNVETDFKLVGAHQDVPCQACHRDNIGGTQPATECAGCHRGADIHSGRHGQECESCHNTTEWGQILFDHDKASDWPLLGKHKSTDCLQCHQGSLHDESSTECRSCHSADDVHRSEELDDCSRCHQAQDWAPKTGFDHELTRFPLEGLHAIASCQGCHQDKEFHQTGGLCVDCHQSEDAHSSALGSECQSCHGPNGWSLWAFDHTRQTRFELSGSHAGLSCDSCHVGKEAGDVPGSCAGCHAGDDRHDGSFGDNCGRCHSSDSFGDIQWRN